MTDDLHDLDTLAADATPGPWHECPMRMFVFGPRDGDLIASTDENGELLIRGFGARLPMEANALYIAAANPTRIRALIAEVRALRAALDGIPGEGLVSVPKEPTP